MTLLLEVQGPHTFRFHVQGAFEPRLEPEWERGRIRSLREVWEIPGARFLSTDAAFWDRWTEFLGLLRTRDPGVSVRLLDVTGPQEREVWRLGTPTHEDFRIEQIRGRADDLLPQSSWRNLAAVTLTISAVQRFADTEGVTSWSQEISNRYDPGGLQVLEWRTEITTREGVSALERARRLGRIDVRPFGDRYSYETNGPEGVDVVALDADERKGRLATQAVAVSRVRQWGTRIGVQGPGEGPTEVSLSRRTRRTPDGVTTTIRATAQGPHALRWVEAKAPSSPTLAEVFEEEARRYAEGVWTIEGGSTPNGEPRLEVKTELSGGHTGFDFEVTANGYPPVLFEGGLSPWRLVVRIRVVAKDVADLRWPQVLPPPWRLDFDGSSETEPFRDGSDWAREATLLYWSQTRPPASPRDLLLNGPKQRGGYVLRVPS